MSKPAPKTNKFEWWTTYTVDDGHWTNSQYEPDAKLVSPPASEVTLNHTPIEVEYYPILRYALFGAAVAAGASQTSVRNYVYNALASSFTKVDVTFTTDTGNELRISYGPPQKAEEGTRELIGALVGEGSNPDIPIEAALSSALSHHLLPDDETWKLSPSPQ